MKTRILFLFILSMAIETGFSQQKAARESTDEIQPGEMTEMLVNSRDFVFHARRALPSGGNSIDLTTSQNYVKFMPDFIESYMPFFGRAYAGVGYSDEGLHFKGKPGAFEVEKTRGVYKINVTVKGETDTYKLFLSVSSDGSASLFISSNNRETMNYLGEIVPPEKEK